MFVSLKATLRVQKINCPVWIRHLQITKDDPRRHANGLTAWYRERERDRFVGCNYTRKKTPMRNSRRTYAANPSHRDRKELEKWKQMFSQKFTNSLKHSITT